MPPVPPAAAPRSRVQAGAMCTSRCYSIHATPCPAASLHRAPSRPCRAGDGVLGGTATGGCPSPMGVRLGDTPWGHGAVGSLRGWLSVCVCTLVFVHAVCVHTCAACVCTAVRSQPHQRAHALFHACPHPRGDLTPPPPPNHSSAATRVPCTTAHAWPLQPLHTQPCTPRPPACPWDAPAALSPRPRGQRNGGRRRGLQLSACLAAQGRAGRAPGGAGHAGGCSPSRRRGAATLQVAGGGTASVSVSVSVGELAAPWR